MKAIVWTAYGPPEVLQLREVPTPEPKDNELLIQVHASTATAGDCEMRALKLAPLLALPMRFYYGVRRPTRANILGQEMAGEVEAVGPDVTQYQPGDRVLALMGFGQGAYAEYVCLPETPSEGVLATMPAEASYEQAASLPLGGLESMTYLGKAGIEPGQTVLINGAGGSIGTIGLQLARHWGAEVTAVDHAAKLDMLQKLGATQVIDYTQQDYAQTGQTWDVVFDIVGNNPLSRGLGALQAGGTLLVANPKMSQMLRGQRTVEGGKRVIAGASGYESKDLEYLRDLMAQGIITPVIDRRYPLEQVAEAHRYVETGQKQGSVVIEVA
jgi:NADPH:quinone reductase-like Zn-dependent oxidoreductase